MPPARHEPGDATGRPLIAWVLPTLARSFYFQPVFKEVARLFPGATVFTGLWPGYLEGYERTFGLQMLRGVRQVRFGRDPHGYGRSFSWVSPTLILKLLRFRPRVVIVGGFNIALAYAAVVKSLTGCRILLLWDGNAVHTTFPGNKFRARLRRCLGLFLDGAVSNTANGARYLQDTVGLQPGQISQVTYQVPDAGVLTTAEGSVVDLRTARTPVFLFAGRLLKGKGAHHLLEAAGMLVKEGLDSFSLVLVGGGPEDADLRSLAAALNIEDKVFWMGDRPYGELGTFFKACDVFVLPSLQDCRPLVVSEAMCFGKAILCSRNTDLEELVRPGENGFFFDPEQPRELASQMALFIESPELVAQFGARSADIIRPYTAAAAAEGLAKAVGMAVGVAGGAW